MKSTKRGQYTDVSGALGTAVNGQLGKLDPGLVMLAVLLRVEILIQSMVVARLVQFLIQLIKKPVLAHRLTQKLQVQNLLLSPNQLKTFSLLSWGWYEK